MYAARPMNLGAALGALPPEPPAVRGYDWFRYMEPGSGSQQRRVCPPNTQGCQIIDGYAWGQMTKTSGEWAPEATPQQFCAAFFTQWANDNPDKVRCLQGGDRDTLIGWCVQAVNGELTQAEAGRRVDQLVGQRCTETYTVQCRNEAQAWARQNPAAAACLRPEDEAQLLSWCMSVKRGVMTPQVMINALDQLVESRCAEQEPVIPASPPAPPPEVIAEPVPDVPEEALPVPNGGDFVVPTGAPEPSALRQWGPIVGLGLLAAVVLTAMRR